MLFLMEKTSKVLIMFLFPLLYGCRQCVSFARFMAQYKLSFRLSRYTCIGTKKKNFYWVNLLECTTWPSGSRGMLIVIITRKYVNGVLQIYLSCTLSKMWSICRLLMEIDYQVPVANMQQKPPQQKHVQCELVKNIFFLFRNAYMMLMLAACGNHYLVLWSDLNPRPSFRRAVLKYLMLYYSLRMRLLVNDPGPS